MNKTESEQRMDANLKLQFKNWYDAETKEELLEACKWLLENLDDADETKGNDGLDYPDIAAMRKAISRAEGSTTEP